MDTPRPVLVGYADDAAGGAAFRAAAIEARLRGTSLTVMHQLVGTEAPERYGPSEHSADNRRAAAYELLRKAHDAAPGIEHIDLRITTGAIAQELVLASKEASLIVLGATTKHPAAAVAFDTVPHEVVRRSHCPVLLVPAECTEWQGAPVVCGIDRSAASIGALHWAADEAARRGVVVHAVEIVRKQPADQAGAHDADSLQRWVREHLPHSATTVICTTDVTHVSHRLLEIAREGHGLLVIGAHERSGWRFASVARAVTSQTQVPVVVVPVRASLELEAVSLGGPAHTASARSAVGAMTAD